MSVGFWHDSNPAKLAELTTKLTDYKFNKPDEFKKIVAKERQQIQGDSLAEGRFNKFLKSLPKTPEEIARNEQRRANDELLRNMMKKLPTKSVEGTETITDENGKVISSRRYKGTEYRDPVFQAFYEWARRQDVFNTDEFHPGDAYKEFFTSYLSRLKTQGNRPKKRATVGRPSEFNITNEEREIAKRRFAEERKNRRMKKDEEGKTEHRSYVRKGFWPQLANELRPGETEEFTEALRNAVKEAPNRKKKRTK